MDGEVYSSVAKIMITIAEQAPALHTSILCSVSQGMSASCTDVLLADNTNQGSV